MIISHQSTENCIANWISQGSVLGSLLSDVLINDIVLIRLDSEICNFADDNTIFSCGKDILEIVTYLESGLSRLREWFTKNVMVANPKKFHIILLGLNGQRGLRHNIEVCSTFC